ncbi:hypothetical protein KAT80_03815, partial [Candidatus Pacearchaeota archaeon]|nr:hypothetical protein [Candidatus Pacearchaeota archaeon]
MKKSDKNQRFFHNSFFSKNHRALSTVVTSLIIILLVLVAVGILWIVIVKIISSGTEQMSLGKLTMNLEIKEVKVNENNIEVRVKRNTGAGELSGIKFIVSDGMSTEIFEEPTTMQELGSNTFTLNYNGLVKQVSIAPIFETDAGKEFTGNELDEFEFSNAEMMENFGAISWWRFENNAQDEIGGNHGEEFGGVDCDVEGKYGKACEFDGVDDYV